MRRLFVFAFVFGTVGTASAQMGRPKTPEEIPPRYGVTYKEKAYSQASPKDALQSAIEAAEKGDFRYLVAHLLEPAFVDARIAERAQKAEPAVAANLAALRDYQQQNLLKVERDARVPVEPAKFRERVIEDAKVVGFDQLVHDVQDKFADDPETLKILRAYRSQGNFPDDKDAGDAAKIGAVDVKDRLLFLKKIGDRWFIENRQVESAEPAKLPEEKKL